MVSREDNWQKLDDLSQSLGSVSSNSTDPVVINDHPAVQLPDASFLIYGQFEKVGFDLVITNPDGEVFIVEDYFSYNPPPNLMLANGAGLPPEIVFAKLHLPYGEELMFAGPAASAAALVEVGKVTLTLGKVTAIRVNPETGEQEEIELKKGSTLYKGDDITTTRGWIKAKMVDGTIFNLGRNANAILSDYAFDAAAGEGKFEAFVTRGAFHYRSGDIGKLYGGLRDHSTIKTPSAFIGIRGSALDGNVDPSTGFTTVIHRDGFLTITDINGDNPVVLEAPGNTSLVTFSGPPSKTESPSPDQIQQLQENLPPQEATVDDPDADQDQSDDESQNDQDAGPEGQGDPDAPGDGESDPDAEGQGEPRGEGEEDDPADDQDDPNEGDDGEEQETGEGDDDPAARGDEGGETENREPPAAGGEERGAEPPGTENQGEGQEGSAQAGANEGEPQGGQQDDPGEGGQRQQAEGQSDGESSVTIRTSTFGGNQETDVTGQGDQTGIGGGADDGAGSNNGNNNNQGTQSEPNEVAVENDRQQETENDDPVLEELLPDTAPVAVDDTLTVTEAGSVEVTGLLLANDSDRDEGQTPSVFSIQAEGSQGGTMSLTVSGDVSYTPSEEALEALKADETATETFTYLIRSGELTDSATLTVQLVGSNVAPIAEDDFAETIEDEPITIAVLENDSDDDGDQLSIQVVGESRGTVVIAEDGAALDYSPPDDLASGEEATDTFVYFVTDGEETSSATVSVALTGRNDPPVVNTDAPPFEVQAVEGPQEIPLSAIFADADLGDELTVVSIDTSGTKSQVTIGSIIVDTGGQFAELAEGEIETDSFFVTVQDQFGATATAQYTFEIVGVNDAPQAADDNFTGIPGGGTGGETFTGNVLENDTDIDNGAILFAELDLDALNGTVVLGIDGSFSYTPNEGFEGDDDFVYVLFDEFGGTDSATVTLRVGAANLPPDVLDDQFTVTIGNSLSANVLSNDLDPDDDPITAEVNAGPGRGTLVSFASDGSFVYQPNEDQASEGTFTDSFTYTVSDAGNRTTEGTATIRVLAFNDPPQIFNPGNLLIPVDEDFQLDLYTVFVDPENADLQFTLSGGNADTFIQDGFLVFSPQNGDEGLVLPLTISASDGENEVVTSFDLEVESDNLPPEALSFVSDVILFTDESFDLSVGNIFVDPEDDPLVLFTANAPGFVSLSGDVLSITPGTADAGNYSVILGANDGQATATTTFSVFIFEVPADDATVAVGGDFVIGQEDFIGSGTTSVTISAVLEVEDDDGFPNADVFVVSQQPEFGSASIDSVTGSWTYFAESPDLELGFDSFTVDVTDQLGNVTPIIIDVLVQPYLDLNPPFVVSGDSATGDQDADITGTLVISDLDTNSVLSAFQIDFESGAPLDGDVEINPSTGEWFYTPDLGFTGTDSFDVIFKDFFEFSETFTVTVEVEAVNEPPSITAPSTLTVDEDQPATPVITIDDPDAGTDPIFVSVSSTIGTVSFDTAPAFAFQTGAGRIQGELAADFSPGDTEVFLRIDLAGATFGLPVVTADLTVYQRGNMISADALVAGGAVGDDFAIFQITSPSPDGLSEFDLFELLTSGLDALGPFSISSSVFSSLTDAAGTAVPLGVDSEPEFLTSGIQFQSTLDDANSALGNLLFQGRPDETGTGTFSVFVDDLAGALAETDSTTFPVTINAVNDAPIAVDDDLPGPFLKNSSAFPVNVSDNDFDPENDDLIITAINDTLVSPGATVSSSSGQIRLLGDGVTLEFTPATDFTGPVLFSYTLSDGSASSIADVTFDIVSVNDNPPVADDESFSVAQDGTATQADLDDGTNLLDGDTDLDGNSLSVITTPLIDPKHGTVTLLANGDFTYDHDGSDNPTDTFAYQVTDGSNTDTGTVTVSIEQPPVLTSTDFENVVVNSGTSVTIPLEFDDLNGDQLTISVAGLPPGFNFTPSILSPPGTVAVFGPTVSPGSNPIDVVVSDGGLTTTESFNLLVQATTDQQTGTVDADLFFGSPGDDTVDGGGGVDEILYTGLSSEYEFDAYLDSTDLFIDVEHSGGGRSDGIDSLLNVESVKFADATFFSNLNVAVVGPDFYVPVDETIINFSGMTFSGINNVFDGALDNRGSIILDTSGGPVELTINGPFLNYNSVLLESGAVLNLTNGGNSDLDDADLFLNSLSVLNVSGQDLLVENLDIDVGAVINLDGVDLRIDDSVESLSVGGGNGSIVGVNGASVLFEDGSDILPTTGGAFVIDADVEFHPDAEMSFDILGPNTGDFDQIVITGDLDLGGGSFDLDDVSGIGGVGEVYTLVTANNITGEFLNYNDVFKKPFFLEFTQTSTTISVEVKAITFQATTSTSTITMTAGVDLVGGTSAADFFDLTSNSSGDQVFAETGNDTILINSLDFARVNGSTGTDTLMIDSTSGDLDFRTTTGYQIDSIEIINADNGTPQTLTFSLYDSISINGEENLLKIIAGAEDSVVLHVNAETELGDVIEDIGGEFRIDAGLSGNDETNDPEANYLLDVEGLITIVGNKSILIGSSGAETIMGTAFDDEIATRGGADTVYAGDGDDDIYFDSTDVLIDGGAGNDELEITTPGQDIDLTVVNPLVSVEEIDLFGDGANVVSLGMTEVLASGTADFYITDGTVQLYIGGDSEDAVVLDGIDLGSGSLPTGVTRLSDMMIGEDTVAVLTDGSATLLVSLNLIGTPTVNSPPAGFAVIGSDQEVDFLGEVGNELKAELQSFSDADGTSSATFQYEWFRDGTSIQGPSTVDTYTTGIDDISSNITFEVTYIDDAGFSELVVSDSLHIVPQDSNVSGTDSYLLSNLDDFIEGSDGNDQITLIGIAAGQDFVDLGDGADELILGDGGNVIKIENVETLTGGTGSDSITITGELSSLTGILPTLTSGDSIYNEANIQLDGETATGDAAFFNESGGVLQLGGGLDNNITVKLFPTNYGQVVLDGEGQSTLTVDSGVFSNYAFFRSSSTGSGGPHGFDGEFVNASTGFLSVDRDLEFKSLSTLDLTEGGSAVGDGATLSLENGTLYVDDSTFIVGGTGSTIEFRGSSGTLDITSSYFITNANPYHDFTKTQVSVSGSGSVTLGPGASLDLNDDFFGVALTNQGNVTVTGGTSTFADLISSSLSTLIVEANGSEGYSALDVDGGYTNNGTLILDNADSSNETARIELNGTLNNSGAILVMDGDASLTTTNAHTITGTLSNDANGRIELEANLDLDETGAGHINNGTSGQRAIIELDGASLFVSGTGSTLINGVEGVIQGQGTINTSAVGSALIQAGLISPDGNSPGLISFVGGLNTQASSVITLDIFNFAGSHDQINVSGGALNLAGTIDLNFLSTSGINTLTSTTVTNVISYESLTGSVSAVNHNLGAGFSVNLLDSGTGSGTVDVQIVPSFEAVFDGDIDSSWGSTTTTSGTTTTNWAPNVLPGSSDDVLIDGFNVAFDGGSTDTIRSLTLINSTLDLESGSLTLNENSRIGSGSTLNLSPTTTGTLTVNRALINEGTLGWDEGSITTTNTTTGVIENLGTINISPGTSTGFDIRVENRGNVNFLGGGELFGNTAFENYGELNVPYSLDIDFPVNNFAGGVVQLGSTTTSTFVTHSQNISNQGTYKLETPGAHDASVTLDNANFTNLNGGIFQVLNSGTGTTSRTLDLAGYDFNNQGGLVSVDAELDVLLAGSTFDTSFGSIFLGADLNFDGGAGGTINLTGASAFFGSGTVNFSNTVTLNVTSNMFLNASGVSFVSGTGVLTIAGQDFSLGGDTNLTLSSGDVVSNSLFQNFGNLSLVGDGISITGGFENNHGGHLKIDSGSSPTGTTTQTIESDFTNNGTIEWYQQSSFTNTLDINGSGYGYLTNQGVLQSSDSGSGTGFNELSATLYNYRAVDVDYNLRIEETAGTSVEHENYGTISIDSGAELEIGTDDTLVNKHGGIIAGGGTLDVAGSLVEFRNDGRILPGDASDTGILTIELSSDHEFTDQSNFEFELNGVGAGTNHDQLAFIGSSPELRGTANIRLLNTFTPATGQTFTIVSSVSVFATLFDQLHGTDLYADHGVVFQAIDGGTTLTLTAVTPTLVGQLGDDNGEENSSLFATPGVDVIHGRSGDDLIEDLGLDDTAFGGEGDDRINANTLTFSRIDGGAGNDSLQISAAVVDLRGIDGYQIDSIEALNFKDDGVATTITLDSLSVRYLVDERNDLTGRDHSILVYGDTEDHLILEGDFVDVGTDFFNIAQQGFREFIILEESSYSYQTTVLIDDEMLTEVRSTDGSRTYYGSADADELTPDSTKSPTTAMNDVLMGRAGNDTLDGGLGSDIINGGAGNDTIILDLADSTIDGGMGFDVLSQLDSNASIDLTGVSNLQNVESISIKDGDGNDQLTLGALDILGMLGDNSLDTLLPDGRQKFLISADAGDVINIDGNVLDEIDDLSNLTGGWSLANGGLASTFGVFTEGYFKLTNGTLDVYIHEDVFQLPVN